MPPISWTSKWRIPSVRFIASRAIAKTSGRTSSRAAWSAACSRLRRAFASSRRRSRSGWVQLVLGRLAGDGGLVDLLADRGEALADLVVGQGGDLGLELVDLVDRGWIRRSSRSFESTKLEKKCAWP